MRNGERDGEWYLRRLLEMKKTVRWASRMIVTHKKKAVDRATLWRVLNGVGIDRLTNDEWLQLDLLLGVPEREIKERARHQLEERIEEIRLHQAGLKDVKANRPKGSKE